MAKVTHYVVLGIDEGHLKIRMLAWGIKDFIDSSDPHRIMEWTGVWSLMILIEFNEDGLAPSVRRFRRKQTWELVGIDA